MYLSPCQLFTFAYYSSSSLGVESKCQTFQLYDVIIITFLPHLYVKETIAEKIQLNFYSVSQQLVAGIIKYISIIPMCIMSGHHYK